MRRFVSLLAGFAFAALQVFVNLFPVIALLGFLVWISLPQFASMSPEVARRVRERKEFERTVEAVRANGPHAPENGKPYDLTFFESRGVNPFVATEECPTATFGMDVDTASFGVAKRHFADGRLPDPASVRVEEFVNALTPQDPPPEEGLFAVSVEGAKSRFGDPLYHLLRVNVRARDVAKRRKSANVVFVVDVSGSMAREDRLGLVKRSLSLLAPSLQEEDRVALVTYGSFGKVDLPLTTDRRRFREAVDALATNGSTNVEEGLVLAYRLAREAYDPSRIHRVVLCTDGVGNVGKTGAKEILAQVKADAGKGIFLTCLGFGMGNYNDVFLDTLATHGDGRYHYVNDLPGASRLFERGGAALLDTVASDAKIQVAFDPAQVDRYRLLGYESRAMENEAFDDDLADAGEIGPGDSVTALFEIRLRNQENKSAAPAPLATVRVRALDLAAGARCEMSREVRAAQVDRPFAEASARFRFSAAVAEFAELLRGSPWAKGGGYEAAYETAREAFAGLERPGAPEAEMLDLLRLARTLHAAQARK